MLPAYALPTWNEIGVGLANHIWQSTVFMIAVGALMLLFRKNRAVVRYRLWLIASVKFLIPFSLLAGIGALLDWHPAPQFMPIDVPVVIRQMSEPFAVTPARVSTPSAPAVLPDADQSVAPLIAIVWFVGAVSVLMLWYVRWLRIARIVRSAKPFEASLFGMPFHGLPQVRILSSPAGLEPGVFGVFRPVLLMPEDISQNLNSAELKAVVAHEMFHVRGRDNFAATVHAVVQAAFWFHPLVWWLGNRLVDERERACDEAVLKFGCEPADYAEGIIKVCKCYVVAPACVAGVSGSNLRRRIEVIMENRERHSLTFGRKLMLAFAGAGILVGPLLSGVAGMPKAAEVQIVSLLASPPPVYTTAPKAAVAVIAQAPAPAPQQVPPGFSIEEVSVIITDAERAAFRQLQTDMERALFTANFWLRRDPTPGTPENEFRDEYSRRVANANDHYTTRSGIPGSQTDRGKMYILNGLPDEIVSRPTGGSYQTADPGGRTASTFPYEVWRYRHIDGKGDNLVYEFVDKLMNSEYTLEYDPSAKDAFDVVRRPR